MSIPYEFWWVATAMMVSLRMLYHRFTSCSDDWITLEEIVRQNIAGLRCATILRRAAWEGSLSPCIAFQSWLGRLNDGADVVGVPWIGIEFVPVVAIHSLHDDCGLFSSCQPGCVSALGNRRISTTGNTLVFLHLPGGQSRAFSSVRRR